MTMALTREELVDIVQTAIAAALVPIQTDLREIKTDVATLKTDVGELKTDVAELKADVATLKTDVATLKTKVDAVGHEVKVLAAKQANSTKGRDDVLEPVPFPIGARVFGDGVMPLTLAHLSVSGSENLPCGARNIWNNRKSKNMLRTYGEGSESDEGEVDELGPIARRRRIKLARNLGITTAQLNQAKSIL